MSATPSPSAVLQADAVVIGAGTAGMHAFHHLQRAGLTVYLVDAGPLGTTCARVGCMPSKAVLHAARRWQTLRGLMPAQWQGGGLPPGHTTPQQLWEQALATRDQLVAGNVAQLHRLAGERLLLGRARFAGPRRLVLDTGPQIDAAAFVLATGTEPVVPEALQQALGERLLTTDQLFRQASLPQRVAVLGLGAIGLEMGLALARLGVHVWAAGRSPVLAGQHDPEVAEAARQCFGQEMDLALGTEAQATRTADGRVQWQAGAQQATVDWVLAALGRRPRTAGMDLALAGVQLDKQGRPCCEGGGESEGERVQAAGSRVFVAGDVGATRQQMHEAADGGVIAAQALLRCLGRDSAGQGRPLARSVPLSIIFSGPDLASVGPGWQALQARSAGLLVGTARGDGNGRSKILHAPGHVLRLYADADSRRLLGASLLCEGGEHLAHLLAWAVQRGETVDSLRALPYYHPTVEEMVDNALKDMRHSAQVLR